MHLSDQRSPLGRQLLSAPAKRQAKEVQRLRRNARAMRSQARRNDRRKESGDRGRKEKGETGMTKGATMNGRPSIFAVQ